LEAQLQSYTDDLKQERENHEQAKTEIARLREELGTLRTIESEHTALRAAQTKALEDLRSQLEQGRGTLDARVCQLEENLGNQTKELGRALTTIQDFEARLSAANSTIEHLQSELSSRVEERDISRRECDDLKAQVQNLRREQSECEAARAAVEERLRVAEGQLSDASSKDNDALALAMSLYRDCSSLNEEIRSIQEAGSFQRADELFAALLDELRS
jgi:chromosome segregation ATPase